MNNEDTLNAPGDGEGNVAPAAEPTPEEVREQQLADSQDNNDVIADGEKAVCAISGAELKEGDEVVQQVVPATEGSEGYSRLVLLSSLSEEERAALPEGSVKIFPVA